MLVCWGLVAFGGLSLLGRVFGLCDGRELAVLTVQRPKKRVPSISSLCGRPLRRNRTRNLCRPSDIAQVAICHKDTEHKFWMGNSFDSFFGILNHPLDGLAKIRASRTSVSIGKLFRERFSTRTKGREAGKASLIQTMMLRLSIKLLLASYVSVFVITGKSV